MVSLVLIRPFTPSKSLIFSRCARHSCRLYSTKDSKPLRILFCGSDEFSISSLRAIHELQKRKPELIKSIDVLCRPGKPAGRSLKKIREVPIKAAAQELGLALHERDTFTGWNLPKPDNESINLIVAVSFGLFVPSRILESVEYGGLNLHPSLLPDYRGPAPLQHMLIRKAEDCGVTLQTLDHKSFDNGTILAQKWFPIQPNTLTYQGLLDVVTPKAVSLLVKGLQTRVFVPPLEKDSRWEHKLPKKLRHASKITSADKRIYWQMKSAAVDIPARQRALGRLWTSVLIGPTTPKRLVFEDSETVNRPKQFLDVFERKGVYKENLLGEIGRSIHFFVENQELRQPILYVEDGDAVIFRTPNKGLRVKRVTIEGQETKEASKALASLRLADAWSVKLKPQEGKARPGACVFEAVPRVANVENVTELPKAAESKAKPAVEPSEAKISHVIEGEELADDKSSQESRKEAIVETK